MSWWRQMLDRWRWAPPEDEVAAKEQRSAELHQAAIDVRVNFEESSARTRPLIRRLEQLAARAVRENTVQARADYARAEASRVTRRRTVKP